MNAWGEQTAALGETLGAGDRDYNRQIVSSIHSPKGGPGTFVVRIWEHSGFPP